MPERDPLLRLVARMARGRPIDWDAEERAAATEADRAAIRNLRDVAAMNILNRALMSSESSEALSESISQAKTLSGSSRSAVPSDLAEEEIKPRLAPTLAAGTRWGPLEVLEHVGAGAFGDVYRARDPRLDREVALKVLRRDVPDPNSEVVREARLLAAVRHPNVVTVHGADRIEGRVGIWTEFLRGLTLERILRERGVLDSREAALIGIDVCRALSAAHAAGIVHQDVKLSNIMRAEGGRIVLMDFGLGGEVEPIRRTERRLSGTPLFMAPEVLRGDRPNARSDLYSLGVVLFSLVTGSLPVEASTLGELRARHARGEKRHARDLRPDLPEAFVRVLDRVLAPEAQERYQTAGETERALRDCLGAPVTGEAEPGARTRAQAGVPHRLPAENDAFIGREAELVELARRFHDGARLVTLLGPGGIGKTRLAVRFAWNGVEDWPGGTWFCDLTQTGTRDEIASIVGEALGVPVRGGDAVAQLGHALARRGRCLVILDNFEQVVETASETVAPWLAQAPEARFLVTSREPLRLPGEHVRAIDALPIERGVELFVERAQRTRRIEPDEPDAAVVREVVRLLEGIPLAIELATGRLRVMTPSQMVDRIAERFRLLASGGSGRHATLHAAIDGSWELLKPWEKAAFAQCSVFEGGFTLEAAEGVLDLESWPDAPWIVDVLQSLVEKSLLRAWVPATGSAMERSGTKPAMRFGMFVSLQEFAREKLAEEGSIPARGSGVEAAKAAEHRHARWFARLEDSAVGRGLDKFRVLSPELDNLVAACRRMMARGDWDAAALCYRSACRVLDLKGPITVGLEMGTQILHSPLAPNMRSNVLIVLGHMEQRAGRVAAARQHFEEKLALDRQLGNRRGEAHVLSDLGNIAIYEGRTDEALSRFEMAIPLLREVGERGHEALSLGNLGLALQAQGRLEEASAQIEASLAIHRELKERRSEGIVLGNLADVRAEQGRGDDALALFEAALEIHREVGNRRFEGTVLTLLGTLCSKLGRMEEARAHLDSALQIHREVGNPRFEGESLAGLADLAFTRGRLDEARARFHEALAIHRAVQNRRSEGIVLGSLAAIDLAEGRIAEARDLIAQGAELLRSGDCRAELGRLICIRAELEHRIGDSAAAVSSLAEAEAIAAQIGAGPESDLGRRLARVRETVVGAHHQNP